MKKLLFLLSIASISLNPFIKTAAQNPENSCLSTNLKNFSCLLIDNFDTGEGGVASTIINDDTQIYTVQQTFNTHEILGGSRIYGLYNVRHNTQFDRSSISTNNGYLSWSNGVGVLSNASVGWIVPDNIDSSAFESWDTIAIKVNTIDLNAELTIDFKTYLEGDIIESDSSLEDIMEIMKDKECDKNNIDNFKHDEIYHRGILCKRFGTKTKSNITDNSLLEFSSQEIGNNMPSFSPNLFNIIEISLTSNTPSVDASIDYIEFRENITSTSEPRTIISLLILSFITLPKILYHFK